MKVILFDLDDTIYPEMEFVESGFRRVARYLDLRFRLGEEPILDEMMALLQKEGRGRVFDTVLRCRGLYSEERKQLMVYLYRSHRPEIRVYPDALPTLRRLRDLGFRLGLLTDGMASVQKNKILALGLESFFDAILCCDELGRDCWKPSGTPYEVLLELLDGAPSEAAYVGNDPGKDFIWPNQAGMISIQVLRGVRSELTGEPVPESACAQFVVESLEDLLPIVCRREHVYQPTLHGDQRSKDRAGLSRLHHR